MADHIIILRAADAGFSVSIEPPSPEEAGQTFQSYKQARGYAGGLRLVKGWKLSDLAESEVTR